MVRIIGIDPGSVSGAFAVLDGDGSIIEVDDIPVVNRQVNASHFARALHEIVNRDHTPVEVIIEDVWAMPRQGIASAFRFGVGVGLARGVILGMGFPLHAVTPTKWKKYFRLDNDGEKSRDLAIRMWPQCRKLSRKKDHGRAEALLLARYHLEQRSNENVHRTHETTNP